MPDVLVRDLPQDVYDHILAQAKAHHRTVPGEIRFLLEKVIIPRNRQATSGQALAALREMNRGKRPVPVTAVELLREDRNR